MSAIWIFLPILGAFLAHAPVLRFDLAAWTARPIDGGAMFRGARVFGDNKTWRGFFTMAGGICVAAVLLSCWPAYWSRLPAEIRAAGPWAFGLLLGFGAVLAELPNSFFKRRLDLAPGGHRRSWLGAFNVVLDQGDFILGGWVALMPVYVVPLAQLAIVFGVFVGVHLLVNVIGYGIGARKTWI